MCDRCQRNAPQLKTAAMELQSISVTPKVWYLVRMDLIGPFRPTAMGHQFVLTMTDYFSKYVEAVPLQDKSAVSVARGIYEIYCRQGAPVHIISDQGKEFVNQTNEALQKAFSVKMRITAAYHPQSNGLDERTNQTLKRSLSKLMEDPTDDWSSYLSSAVFATNTSIQKSTKFTPFCLMYGREARFPLEAEKLAEVNSIEEADDDISLADIDNYIKEILENQKAIFSKTDMNIKAAQEKQKKQYAKRKGITEYKFKIGDKVLRRNMQQKTRKGKKMEDRWLGPYTIVEVTKTSCLLKNTSGKVLKQRINLNQLKPYNESNQPDPATNASEEDGCNSQTEPDNDMNTSGSNERERSVLACFESDTLISTPVSVSSHSPTSQDFKISPIHEQEGVLEEHIDYSDDKITGKSLVDSVLTTPKGISECRKNLQFTNSLDKDQRCAVKRVKKRKMINDILEGANRNNKACKKARTATLKDDKNSKPTATNTITEKDVSVSENSKLATTEAARRFNGREEKVSVKLTEEPNSLSKKMQSIIDHCSHFTAKPLGPIYACVKDEHIRDHLPSDFLDTYIVNCPTDSELLKTLCQQHNEPVPDRIVYSFLEKHYDDLEKVPKADKGMIAALKEENPTVANVLVDYLNIHIIGVQMDPDRAMDDYDDLLNAESPNDHFSNDIENCKTDAVNIMNEDKLLRIWNGEPCHTAKAKIGKITIHHGSFHSLKDNGFLNDEIINGYMRLLEKVYGNCYAVLSQTMTAIINRVAMAQPNHLLTREKLTGKKYISGVYNHQGNHWILIVIDFEKQTFGFYDPLGPRALRYVRGALSAVMRYFKKRNEICNDDIIKLDNFNVTQLDGQLQNDGYNCGVICLKIAEQLLRYGSINELAIKHTNLNRARLEIGLSLLKHSVDMTERCNLCGGDEKSMLHQDYTHWVQCDKCNAWVHTKCAGVEKDVEGESFNCLECSNKKKDFIH